MFATSPNAKTILFPVEATQLMGTLGGIGELASEVLGDERQGQPAPARGQGVRRRARRAKDRRLMFDDLEPGWLWAIGGVLLLIAEIIAPGFFLVFVGAAAIATGLFTLLFDLGTRAAARAVRGLCGARGDDRQALVRRARHRSTSNLRLNDPAGGWSERP